ncbi:MAG: hypothetical protein CBC13_01815 [Planctomycetia bacterium TMED53]|nr:MAG: hypothetical protein CBC13_01815 [Planctomycetia bacterium TMED53]
MQGLQEKVATLESVAVCPGILGIQMFLGVTKMILRISVILLVLALLPAGLLAGGLFTMTFGSSSVVQGGQAAVDFSFSHSDPSGVQGFSFGVCHTTSVLDHEPFGTSGDFDEVVDWSPTVETLKQGGAPDFFQQNLESGGWTVGCVICFTSCDVISAGTYDFGTTYYRVNGPVGSIGTVGLCNTLGTPPVSPVAVVSGASLPLTSIDGSIEVLDVPPILFNFTAPDKNVNYDPATGIGDFGVNLSISEDPSNATFPTNTQGFSMSLTTNTTYITPLNAETLPGVDAIQPAFSQAQILPGGWTFGVVYSFQVPVYLQFPSETEVVRITGETVDSELIGDDTGLTVPLEWTPIGTPSIFNVVTANDSSINATTFDSVLTLNPQTNLDYIRGDSNGDGIVNVADVVWGLQETFNNGPVGTCNDAKDSNSDGLFDVADSIWLISYIFTGGAAPAAPFPDCGEIGDPQDCLIYNACL